MGLADGRSLPRALRAESASPAEVTLVEAKTPWKNEVAADVPERLIGNKACDRDRLDQEPMEKFGIEMNTPNRSKLRGISDRVPLRIPPRCKLRGMLRPQR